MAQSWDFEPWLAIHEHPGLLRAGGVAVVLFEIGFVFAVLSRRLRVAAVVAALAFHTGTWAFFNIQFSSLYFCYFVFGSWSVWLGRTELRSASDSYKPGAVAFGILLSLVAVFGAAGRTDSWPVACYPTFDEPIGGELPGLEVVLLGGDGSETAIPMHRWTDARDSQRMWGEVWQITGVTGPVSPARLERLWIRIARRNQLSENANVRFYRANRTLDPSVPMPWSRGSLLHSMGAVDGDSPGP